MPLDRLKSPHFQENRSAEKRVRGEPLGKFPIVAVIQILLVRDLPNETGGRQNNIALMAFAHHVLPIQLPLLVTPKPNRLGAPKRSIGSNRSVFKPRIFDLRWV